MASAIPTMSVPFSPSRLAAPPLQPSSSLLSPSSPIITSDIILDGLPSYPPPARILRQDSCGLTLPSNARTRAPFKPRSTPRGTGSYQLRQFAEATLGRGSLQKAVKLPEGEDLNEWLAVNGKLSRVGRFGPITNQSSASCSGRLLQPNKSSLRLHHRVLLPAVVPGNEGDR